jgi:hypothetical protein
MSIGAAKRAVLQTAREQVPTCIATNALADFGTYSAQKPASRLARQLDGRSRSARQLAIHGLEGRFAQNCRSKFLIDRWMLFVVSLWQKLFQIAKSFSILIIEKKGVLVTRARHHNDAMRPSQEKEVGLQLLSQRRWLVFTFHHH